MAEEKAHCVIRVIVVTGFTRIGQPPFGSSKRWMVIRADTVGK